MAKNKFSDTRPSDLDGLFGPRIGTKKLDRSVWAVRQVRGPGGRKPFGDLVIRAITAVDAQRQWFNFYGLSTETYRYNLQTARVPESHAKYGSAIECQHPRGVEDDSLAKQLEQQLSAAEQVLASSPLA